MLMFSKKTTDTLVLVNLLNQILKLEYALIETYPSLARSIKDEYTSAILTSLAIASVKHVDIVTEAFETLEETPQSHLVNMEETPNLIEFFTQQLDKEKLAMKLLQQCAGLIREETLQFEFSCMAEEEYTHIKIVKMIIFNLKHSSDKPELSLSWVPING